MHWLIRLYEECGGENWANNNGWLGDTSHMDDPTAPICTWHGITCNTDPDFHFLVSLGANNLEGTIPTELANNIPAGHDAAVMIRAIDLGGSGLSGTIPTELGHLQDLSTTSLFLSSPALQLSLSKISGSIPTQLGMLTKLGDYQIRVAQADINHEANQARINLHDNPRLSGTIPPELHTLEKMAQLNVQRNALSGSLPTQLAPMSTLRRLDVDTNLLSGVLPTELGAMYAMKQLYLRQNVISGSIPSEIGGSTFFKCGGSLCTHTWTVSDPGVAVLDDADKTCGSASLTNDGRVVFPPHNWQHIGLFDSLGHAFSSIDISATVAASTPFCGSVTASNGHVVFVPWREKALGVLDPETSTFVLVSDTMTASLPDDAFHGGAMIPDGRIILAPYHSPGVGIFNPTTLEFRVIHDVQLGTPGGDATSTDGSFAGAVAVDGVVVFPPKNHEKVGIFDPLTSIYSQVDVTDLLAGASHPSTGSYFDGGVAYGGRVIFTPADTDAVGIFDVANRSLSLSMIGDTLTDFATPPQIVVNVDGKFAGNGVLLRNQLVYFAMQEVVGIGIFNPSCIDNYCHSLHNPAFRLIDSPGITAITSRFSTAIATRFDEVVLVPRTEDKIGVLPIMHDQGSPSFTELKLDENSLGNAIPTELGRLGRLEELTLSENSLEGELPTELMKLHYLNTCMLDEGTFDCVLKAPAACGDVSCAMASIQDVQQRGTLNLVSLGNTLTDALGAAPFYAFAGATRAVDQVIFAPAKASSVGVFNPVTSALSLVAATFLTPTLSNPGNSKNCGDFATQEEAQAWFDIYFPQFGDVAGLDGDADGSACASRPSHDWGKFLGDHKYAGAATAENGKVIFAPCNQGTVGVFIPSTSVFSYVDISSTVSRDLESPCAFMDTVMASNDQVIFSPFTFTQGIGVFDPDSEVFSVVAVNNYQLPAYAFWGAVSTGDGQVVFAPCDSTGIGVYEAHTSAFSLVDISVARLGGTHGLDGTKKFSGAALATNGQVIFAPLSQDHVGVFNPATRVFTLVSTSILGGILAQDMFSAAIAMSHGEVFFTPLSNTHAAGVYNAFTSIFKLVVGGPATTGTDGDFLDGVAFGNDDIVFAPYNENAVGMLTRERGFPLNHIGNSRANVCTLSGGTRCFEYVSNANDCPTTGDCKPGGGVCPYCPTTSNDYCAILVNGATNDANWGGWDDPTCDDAYSSTGNNCPGSLEVMFKEVSCSSGGAYDFGVFASVSLGSDPHGASLGKLIMAPYQADTVGMVDPTTFAFSSTAVSAVMHNANDGTQYQIKGSDLSVSLGSLDEKFSGAAESTGGLVVFAPYNADSIGIFNPSTEVFSLFDISQTIWVPRKFRGAAATSDGQVIFAPCDALSVGVYTPPGINVGYGADTFLAINITYNVSRWAESELWRFDVRRELKFNGAALATNGLVIFAPGDADAVGIFDPSTSEFWMADVFNPYAPALPAELLGGLSPLRGDNKFRGATALSDGRIIFTPHNSSYVVLFDPNEDTSKCHASIIPCHESWLIPIDHLSSASNDQKFAGGALLNGPLNNGLVVFAPYDSGAIGVFDPVYSRYSPVNVSNASVSDGWSDVDLVDNGLLLFTPHKAPYIAA